MTHQPPSSSRVEPLDAEPAHLTGAGSMPADVRHYIVGCRASALVLEREGHPQEAGYLRDAAATAEAAERQLQQPPPTGGERR